MTSAHLLPLTVLAALAGIFVAWPFFGRRALAIHAAEARDHHRQELQEEKAAIYRALHELSFDHEAGHLSEDDYREMRERYESRAAEVLREIDGLGPSPSAPAPRLIPAEEVPPAAAPAAAIGWTRSPATIAVGAMLMVVFGVILGIGVGRFSQPEAPSMPMGAAMPPPPGGPGAGIPGAPAGAGPQTGVPGTAAPAGAMAGPPGQALPPEVLAGMLQAARQMLFQGQYQEAISAYQAVLKRDPNNVDAMTHLALIVAIGGHADSALETWDKAVKIDPKYAPAYLYRGQVLYETKQDYASAIKAWERFVALVPSGQDHDRAQALIKDARAKQAGR